MITLVSVAAALIAADVLLRTRFRAPSRHAGWRADALGVSKAELNQFGFRGRPLEYGDADFVIVMLGASNTEATACAFERIPERRLEHYLNARGKRVRVCSLGSAGYGQDQQLLVLREYFQAHRANLVLVWFSILNDLFDNMFPTHWAPNGWPKPTFWLEDGQLRGPNWSMGEELIAPAGLLSLWRRPVETGEFDREWERRLPPAYKPLPPCDTVSQVWQQVWNANPQALVPDNLATEKSHFASCLHPPSPRMNYAVALTRALMRAIHDLAADHGSRFALFEDGVKRLVPPEEEWDHSVEALNGKFYGVSSYQREALANMIREGHEHYVLPVTVPNPFVSEQDHHNNERALDQLMRDLARRLGVSIPNAR